MTETFQLESGGAPLLISIPHDGQLLAPGMEERMTTAAKSLPDADWHVRKLYEFAKDLDASLLVAEYSRYVVDLNRPPTDLSLYDGQVSTGLCPLATFAGSPIYFKGSECTEGEQKLRVQSYWQPYHTRLVAELSRIRERYGFALLWDAHSIRSQIPNLFQGTLPDLNIGTHNGASCHPLLESTIFSIARKSSFSCVSNGRFTGGYITRNYGNPTKNTHAIQLEISQKCYMNEEDFRYDRESASRLICILREMLIQYMDSAKVLP